jgi:hypothetical protein
MEIEIEDPLNLISKTQRVKVKSLYKERVPLEKILESLHYQEDNPDKRYREIVEQRENDQKVKLIFGETSHHDRLKLKLKNKLHHAEMDRSNQFKDEAWKKYYQLLKHPMIRSLPDETISKALPNPDEIRKQADTYRMINKVNPNQFIKDYIQECLMEIKK